MTPIDDELRNLFANRAADLTPAADPIAGIERRAGRMRRNRAIAAVAGSALAVAAIAVAVPSLLPERDDAAQVASSGTPSPVTSPSAGRDAAALDPARPWAYRGDTSLIKDSELASLRAEWAAKHPGAAAPQPLFGQVYEPSQQPEIVFVAGDRWGMATSSDAGWTFPVDEALAPGTRVLMAALPGDEVPRLLIVAGPSTGDISYAADGRTFTTVPMVQPGVAFRALEGDTSRDVVRVLDGDGNLDQPVFQGAAPDYGTPNGTPAPGSSPDAAQPAEVTSAPALAAKYAFDPASPWAYRGATPDGTGNIVSADRKAFMTSHGEVAGQRDTTLYAAHLSATTDVAVVLHARSDGNWVSFTAHQGTTTRQVAYQPSKGEDILSAYVPLDGKVGLLIGVTSDQAANLVLQTGSRAEVGGSKTAGVWDWTPNADPQARLAAFAAGDIEPYSSQPAT
jgi:hypothetical protein